MSHTISVSYGHVTVTCTLCDLTIAVPEGDDAHVASMQGLELFLHHRINHHGDEQ
jgi:ribosomal protein S27E